MLVSVSSHTVNIRLSYKAIETIRMQIYIQKTSALQINCGSIFTYCKKNYIWQRVPVGISEAVSLHCLCISPFSLESEINFFAVIKVLSVRWQNTQE